MFWNRTNDKQIVRIQAYNQLADFVYSKLNTNDKVFINGYIEDNVVKVKCIMFGNKVINVKNGRLNVL